MARKLTKSTTYKKSPRARAPAKLEASPPIQARGKLGLLVAAVSAPKGACLEELIKATGWQAHTIRAALSGLRKRGMTIELSEVAGRKAYRVGGAK